MSRGAIASTLRAIMDDGPQGEGWAIFEVDSEGHAPFELQRFDDPQELPNCDGPVFESDMLAATHVWEQAQAGSKPHQLALRYLRRFSRPEWIDINVGRHRVCPA